jgi:hypothetical protein
MIDLVIEPRTGLPTINVRFDDSASPDDLRSAWQDVSSGVLASHIRDAIWFECTRRGIEPREIIPDSPAN